HDQDKKVAVLIDEGNMLRGKDAMEEIRGLLNIETESQHLLNFVIFGLPEMEENLKQDEALYQRTAIRTTLKPLEFESVKAYISHRIKVAGGESLPFTNESLELIHRYSGGKPRMINIICENAMLEAFLEKKKEIDTEIMRVVLEDLALVDSYLQGKVKKEDEVETEAGIVRLIYNDNDTVSALMPEVSIPEEKDNGAIVKCGVPHYVIPTENVEELDVDSEGKKLSNTIPGRNNVDWFREKEGSVFMRVFERGVEGETLSCSSGLASVSFYIMKKTGKDKLDVKTIGGKFNTVRESENRLWLTGEANIVFKGEMPEGENSWEKRNLLI
ncbi:MAG: hypothetical protein P8Y62_02785, partial [candidate division WOR-3 bacterium]